MSDTNLFRLAFDAVPYALAIVQADDARLLEVNRGWEQLFGYTREEAVGRRPLDLILYVDLADRERLLERFRRDGFLRDFEISLRTRAGEVRYALVSSEPITVDGAACFLTSVRDITEQRQAEAESERGKRLLERIADATPGVLYVVDWLEKRNVYSNRQIYDVLGYTVEQVQAMGGDLFSNLLHPDDLPRVFEHNEIFETMRDGEVSEVAYRMRHADGAYRWLISRDTVFERMPDGRAWQVLGIAHDVTAHKVAEQALRETVAQNRAILNAIPDMMFLQTFDGVYLDYHTTDPGQLLVSPTAFIGRNMQEVLPGYLSESLFAAFREAKVTGGPVVFEYCLEIRGESRYYEARVVLLDDEKALSIVRDITERRHVEERVKDLAGRLIVAQEDERRRISRDLHDDLNQRIAALTISIANLKRRLPDSPEEIVDRLSELQLGAVDLADTVRVLSHQLHSAVLEHAGLESALGATCDEFAAHTGIAVDFSAEGDAEPVPRDVALCVYRVVQEALRNVGKHAATSRASVLLRCDAREVTARVADEGSGFDYDEAKRRNGLGLVSMEERVRLLHGSLEVDTAPGRGTRLTARLPL